MVHEVFMHEMKLNNFIGFFFALESNGREQGIVSHDSVFALVRTFFHNSLSQQEGFAGRENYDVTSR